MTTKSPANAAHDAARAEDEQRARAELHEYITGLERRLAERTRERDMAQAAERTFALRLRLVHEMLGDPDCEVVLASDLVAQRIHEAEERGMVRGLEHGLALLWSPEAESAREYAARICAEARAKGGDHG